ncbi:MAG TPA: hypothetical protein ENF73_04775, partial [Proteobacteria bacterium]|nr:hypothetical protein [Pseudomonadota bacterium]
AWADVTLERLAEWNFNTLGAWSDVELLGDRMPYTLNLSLSGANWQQGTIPDFFSETFYNRVAQRIESLVEPRTDDPNLVGYFIDNEMRWGPDWRAIRDLFADYFSFDATAPGKMELVDFLRNRYNGDVDAFNRAWGMSIESFDDLLAMTEISPLPSTGAQWVDRAAFTKHVAEHFFRYCHDAIRAADPNHLILGSRFVSWATPKEVVVAAAPYTDVVSVNHYLPWPIYVGVLRLLEEFFGWVDPTDMLVEFHELTGKPILISEFSVRAFDSGLPNTVPPYIFFITLPTQEDRADFFETFARMAFETDYIIGYHWFSYMDEPPEGRFDGENSNLGLVDNEDEPWEELVERAAEVNDDWPIPDDDDHDDFEDDDTNGGATSDDDSAEQDGCGC